MKVYLLRLCNVQPISVQQLHMNSLYHSVHCRINKVSDEPHAVSWLGTITLLQGWAA